MRGSSPRRSAAARTTRTTSTARSGAAREVVGEGETVVRTVRTDIDPLAPYVFLAALLPLAFLLYRRNLA